MFPLLRTFSLFVGIWNHQKGGGFNLPPFKRLTETVMIWAALQSDVERCHHQRFSLAFRAWHLYLVGMDLTVERDRYLDPSVAYQTSDLPSQCEHREPPFLCICPDLVTLSIVYIARRHRAYSMWLRHSAT